MNACRFRAGLMLAVCLMAEGRSLAAQPTWKAGVASANITPTTSLWLAGYASRTNPAEGKAMDLWMKVLAVEDAEGRRALIMTSDTLGIPQGIYQHTCAALKQKFGLEPDQILLTASHTHCGPVLSNSLYDAYPLDEHQRSLIGKFSAEFEAKIIQTAAKALADLTPVRLAAGQGYAGFAVNRRNNPEGKVPKLIEKGSLKGPADHSVPVLAAYLPDGKLKAVLFGYACHNTTLGFNKWSGDYAGFAQLALEKSHPEATAMFFMGCGGDQNPLPRKRIELAERYGNMLAAAVEETLIAPGTPHGVAHGGERVGDAVDSVPAGTSLKTLAPKLKTSLEMVKLNLGPAPSEAELETLSTGTNNASHKRYASRLLAELKAGKSFARAYDYPLAVWRLGDSQILVALGGEPVVDYALKFKSQFGSDTWVAGYSNDVMTYIPSLRVLKEGGYEGGGAMVPYGMPALRWDDDVEELITAAAGRLVSKIRAGE
jgi:hypothetical protein